MGGKTFTYKCSPRGQLAVLYLFSAIYRSPWPPLSVLLVVRVAGSTDALPGAMKAFGGSLGPEAVLVGLEKKRLVTLDAGDFDEFGWLDSAVDTDVGAVVHHS